MTALSGGRLVVRVAPDWKGGDDEARVIKDVAAGEADLGWSGTRAFDLVGVDAFRPLHAPLLVDSYAAEAAVVQDGLAGELLTTLEPLGLTGLALAADELRMIAAGDRPVLAPADLSGRVFHTSPSRIQTETVAALGATPTSTPLPESSNTDVDVVETMWWRYEARNEDDYAPFVTGNAVLWPRTVAVFANAKVLAGLDEESRRWITQAAGDASAWSTMHAGDAEPAQIAAICGSGATMIATASPDQLAALRAATEPVYTGLRADPGQARTLSRVEALVGAASPGQPAPVPDGCAYREGDEKLIGVSGEPLTGPGAPGTLAQGVYRHALPHDELIAAGLDADGARFNSGVYTYTLRDGTWSYRHQPADTTLPVTECSGWYTVTGNSAAFTTTTEVDGGTCAPPTWTARWSAEESTLTWSDVSEADYAFIWAGNGWQKIG